MDINDIYLPRPRQLSPDEISPFGGILQKALANYKALTEAQLAEQNLQQQIANTIMNKAKANVAPQMEQANLQYRQNEIPNLQANTAFTQANTGKINQMLPGELLAQQIGNKYLPQEKESELALKKAQAGYYDMGGGRGGVAQKNEQYFQSLVGRDNPQLKGDPDKIFEASNVLRQGGTQLSDGTSINPLSPASAGLYNNIVKSQTTANLINKNITANQADAELKALNDHINPIIKEAGTTIWNKDIQSLVDSFSNDDKSQTRLGKLIGARALQYGGAQLRNRIDMASSSLGATQELMGNTPQLIDTINPRLTNKARMIAIDTMNQGIEKMLKARNEFGIGASNAAGKGLNPITGQPLDNSQTPNLQTNSTPLKNAITNSTNQFKGQMITLVDKNGNEWDVPQGKVQKFIDTKEYKRK